MRRACLCALLALVKVRATAAFAASRPASRAVHVRWRHHAPLLSEGPLGPVGQPGQSDDDGALAAALRARREELERERTSLEQEQERVSLGAVQPGSATPPEQPPPPSDSGGFRFEDPDSRKFVAGLDTSPDSADTRLLRVFTLYGGRALTALTLASLAFYLYVGLSIPRPSSNRRRAD